jgi:hypothetical protein
MRCYSLECDVMYSARICTDLRRKSLPLSSGRKVNRVRQTSNKHFVAPQKAEALCSSDRSINFTRLHGVVFQKIVLFAMNMDGTYNTEQVEIKFLCFIN